MIEVSLESIEDLLPEEKEELLRQAEGLSPKEVKKLVRRFKLKLDLPDLTDEEREPVPSRFFEEAQAICIMLVDATEEVTNVDFNHLHPNAKGLLISQIKKTIGILAREVSENDK